MQLVIPTKIDLLLIVLERSSQHKMNAWTFLFDTNMNYLCMTNHHYKRLDVIICNIGYFNSLIYVIILLALPW
jgi:hypothetical protein